MQWVFISLIGLLIYLFVRLQEGKRELYLNRLGIITGIVILGFALAAPQLLSTWEMRQVSRRSGGLGQEEIFVFPYPWKNFVTMVLPNFYGTPKDGSFSFNQGVGLFWENTAYIGILPLLFAVLSIFKKKKRGYEWAFIVLGVFSILLIPGRSSPLYFLLTLPGFNNFRIPSRFLLLATFSIAGLAGVGLDWVVSLISGKKKIFRSAAKYFGIVVVVVAIADLFIFSTNYHALATTREALEVPETASGIEAGARIYTHPDQYFKAWGKAFAKGGWQNTEKFLYLKNGLYADINLLFGLTNIRVYAGLYPERYEVSYSLADQLLNTMDVKYIVSPKELESDEELELKNSIKAPENSLPDYYVYENKDRLERVRLVSSYIVRNDLTEVAEVVGVGEFPFDETVILEKDLGESFEELEKGDVEFIEDSDQKLVIKTRTDKKAILMVADSFYPAWKVRVNGEEAEIVSANINQRAVVVPEGESEIEMWYEPRMFYRGLWVSGLAIVVFITFMIVGGKSFNTFRG